MSLPQTEHARTVHLIEVPEHLRADAPPATADLSSDKNAVASTPDPQAGGIDLPQSDGDLPNPSLGAAAAARGELPHGLDASQGRQARGGLQPRPTRNQVDYAAGARVAIDSLGGAQGTAREPAPAGTPTELASTPARGIQPGASEGPAFAQPLPSDLGLGGLSFNTLEWDFAPYALELKRRISSNWYPPVAFTYGGLFGGVSVVRFRIEPDGSLSRVQLISAAEHTSLDTAALNAVKHSALFAPLPADFPERFLEVTFSFHYLLAPRAAAGDRGAGG